VLFSRVWYEKTTIIISATNIYGDVAVLTTKACIRLEIEIEIELEFNQSEERKSISSLVNFVLIGQNPI